MTPQVTQWSAVLERIERLEKQNRKLKQIGAAILLMAACLVLVGQASPQQAVQASEFILKDASGLTRARLGMTEEGPSLDLFNMDGKGIAQLRASGKEARFLLFDASGKARAALRESEDDGPALVLTGASGLATFTDSEIALGDKDGRKRMALALARGEPALLLTDQNQKPRAFLSLDKDEPVLSFFDGNGTKLVTLVVAKDLPSLILSDPNNTIRAELSLAGGMSKLMLLDATGNVRFAKP